ncbi:MAG TPA: SRPBCC domain-containing protein [Candidatus Angelobacter sp.]|nr:SRPBCC domain-containing protein [Candidatus Angelobacter sp.]
MKSQNYTTTFTVDQTPEEAFAAINDVCAWWSGNIEGSTSKLGDEWTYRYKDIHYSKPKITELVPGNKVVWQVVDSYLNFIEDKAEWNGTKITFDIAKKGDKTEVRFSHLGLTPEVECYDACTSAWGGYVNSSLRNLISKGKGQPNRKEEPGENKKIAGPSRLGIRNPKK